MRKLAAICALLTAFAVAGALAGGQYVSFEVSHGTTTTNVLTQTQAVNGYIDEIYIEAPSRSAVTAAVSVVVSPVVGSGLTTTTLYTNATVTAAAKARPRVTQTDNEGNNLSSLSVAERFLCVGDSVAVRVTQSSAVTGVVYKVWIKTKQ